MKSAAHRGRVGAGIIAASVLALILIAATPLAAHWLREPVVKEIVELPLAMPHRKHADTPCAVCHHDYKDKTGRGMGCVLCHKGNDPKLVRSIIGEFHDFCMGCHAEKARTLAKHGPVRECAGCHYEHPDGHFP